MKKFWALAILCLGTISLITLSDGNTSVIDVEGIEVTRDDLSTRMEGEQAIQDVLGEASASNLEEDAIRDEVKKALLQKKYQEHHITLTPDEETYAENYFESMMTLFREKAQHDASTQELLDLVTAYQTERGWTEAEYAAAVADVIRNSLLTEKLVEQAYDNDWDRFYAELDEEIANIIAAA